LPSAIEIAPGLPHNPGRPIGITRFIDSFQ
jgi:hypothetical protein